MNSRKVLLNRAGRLSAVVGAMTIVASGATAQVLTPTTLTQGPVPQVVASGRGEVDVTPNRGELIVQVETRAADGTRASEANAVTVRAVLDTLRRGFNLTDRDLSTIGFSLNPQMVYPGDGKQPQVTGYVASNSVRVRTAQLTRLGAVIDAAIRKGATSISGPSFYAASVDSARRSALAAAVENARRDAEAIAAAAGGRLGTLIEITSEPPEIYRPVPMQVMQMQSRAAVETPIQVGDQKIVAHVTARWRFISP